jgi:hypothetical protein
MANSKLSEAQQHPCFGDHDNYTTAECWACIFQQPNEYSEKNKKSIIDKDLRLRC